VNAKRGLIAAVALTFALAAPAGADARCRTAGAKVLARDATGVVFAKGAKVYACLQRIGAAHRLPTRGHYESVPGHAVQGGDEGAAPSIAGGFVAYAVTGRDPDGYPAPGFPVASVELYDVRRRGVVQTVAAADEVPSLEGTSSVTGLVVKRSGSVAWIAVSNESPRYQPPNETAVRTITRRGTRSTLDANSERPYPPPPDGIDPASLRLTADRGTVTWQHLDGRLLSAPLR
jgi:hypothetical protein